MTDSYTHRYIPELEFIAGDERREQNLVKEEYFSSTDLQIFFDHDRQYQIGYISFTLSEQLKPIYGYHSRTWDDVAIGNRIVTGTLQMPIYNALEPQRNDFSKYDGSSLKKDNDSYSYYELMDLAESRGYNNNENANLNKKEFIGNTDKYTDPASNRFTNDEAKDYLLKLNSLGVHLGNYSDRDITKAIKEFQKRNGIEATGTLTTSTKNLIDNIINSYSLTKISLDNEYAYPSPNKSINAITLSGSNFVVLSNLGDMKLIQNLDNNNCYYIDSNSGVAIA